MNEKPTGIEWFNLNVKPLFGTEFEFKYIESKDGDLGYLLGWQFDSDNKGGYAYFWSSGFVGFHLVDYQNDVELVEDTLMQLESNSYQDVFADLIKYIKL